MSNGDEDDDAKNARDGNLFPPVPSKLVKSPPCNAMSTISSCIIQKSDCHQIQCQ
jgi:hypothetical protein